MKTATSLVLIALLLGLVIATVACNKTVITSSSNYIDDYTAEDMSSEIIPADNPDIGALDDFAVSDEMPE